MSQENNIRKFFKMTVLFLYRFFYLVFSPLILGLLAYRLIKGKEDRARFGERLGFSQKQRPAGKLVWMHGASVGECLSMLPLVKKLLDADKKLHIMVTSGTVTSAALMEKRLPERAFHQYIPIDSPFAARRFVRYWHPQVVLWFESDFWPNLLYAVRARDIPLILLNGRISDRSFARWRKFSGIISSIQKLFTLSFGQTKEDARRLEILGAPQVVSVGNLKFAAVCPPFDTTELKTLKKLIGSRPVWCMASTHAGEEEMGAFVHIQLEKEYKNLLTVLVPRHPNRADDIEEMLIKKKLQVARRSRGDKIMPQTQVYLADTIGEMGLLYQLAPFVFVGGSLVPFGGQNMLEPMRLHRTVFIGPYAFNFREIVARSKSANALIEVADKEALCKRLTAFFLKPAEAEKFAAQAEKLATSEMSVLDRVYRILHEKAGL